MREQLAGLFDHRLLILATALQASGILAQDWQPMQSTQTDSERHGPVSHASTSSEYRQTRFAREHERSELSATVPDSNRVLESGTDQNASSVPHYVRLASLTRDRLSDQVHIGQDDLDVNVARVDYPEDFQRYSSINGKFRLSSESWIIRRSTRPICDVRCVLIRGSKNTIINTWAFPYQPDVDPVYAAELIAFGGMPRLAFLDVQAPGMRSECVAKVHGHVARTCRYFPHLRIKETPPEWAIAATTGNYLFTRDGQASLFDAISDAYLRLLDSYLEFILSSDQDDTRFLVDVGSFEQLRAYQIHHMDHSPGKVFLSKLFGEAWTTSFMNQFLFSPPGGHR